MKRPFPYKLDTRSEEEWRAEETYERRPAAPKPRPEGGCTVCGLPVVFDTCPRCDDDIERDRRKAS